ncbi:MAG: hypothetical protein ACRDKI_06665 [Solirubrobacterales bacterium]
MTKGGTICWLAILLTAALVGCGGDSSDTAKSASGVAAITAANNVNVADFPKTDGKKTFADIQREAKAQQDGNLLPAANDFVAGRDNRLPFGIFDIDTKPIWGPTVLYLSGGTNSPAQGPYPVTAHDLDVPAQFRSKTSAGDYGRIGNGFYSVNFHAPKGTEKLNALTLTKDGSQTEAAATGLVLRPKDPAPEPGEKAPAIETPTLASVNGDVSKIDTRQPPDKMHDVSLKDALKQHKPIVLIFATPALCASRVCGPVVDVASEVQAKEGKNVIFIHNEIYKDNDINAGYRPQVSAYGLTSEPFTFVIGPNGKVVAQLQGPFVAEELEKAIEKAKTE